MSLTVYSFDKVSCLMNGIPVLDFWEGDDVVKIARADDAIKSLVGADGNAIVSLSTDLSATIELKLKPTSITNTALGLLERRFRQGVRVSPVPFVVTDYQTAAVHFGAEAVVLSRPKDISYGKNATMRTWMLFVGRLEDATIGQI